MDGPGERLAEGTAELDSRKGLQPQGWGQDRRSPPAAGPEGSLKGLEPSADCDSFHPSILPEG